MAPTCLLVAAASGGERRRDGERQEPGPFNMNDAVIVAMSVELVNRLLCVFPSRVGDECESLQL